MKVLLRSISNISNVQYNKDRTDLISVWSSEPDEIQSFHIRLMSQTHVLVQVLYSVYISPLTLTLGEVLAEDANAILQGSTLTVVNSVFGQVE